MLRLPDGREIRFEDWYDSEQGKFVLSATDRGRLLFAWEATYRTGETVRQYDDVTFVRAMTDDQFVMPEATRISVDSLNKAEIVQFGLYPTALTRRVAPWFSQPFIIKPQLTLGEQFVQYWLVDEQMNSQTRARVKFYRHVLGIQMKDGNKVLTVICPSGKVIVTSDDNTSYEGE